MALAVGVAMRHLCAALAVVGEHSGEWINCVEPHTARRNHDMPPSMRITGADGTDMELSPPPVDHLVVHPLGASYFTRDSQLDAAVKMLASRLAALR